jgi:hypothetical protein
MRWFCFASLLVFAACRTPVNEPSAPTQAASAQASPAAAAPAHTGCQSDAECEKGQVCARCGDQSGECIAGCTTDADCDPGEACREVQCIRCPCPHRCGAKLDR